MKRTSYLPPHHRLSNFFASGTRSFDTEGLPLFSNYQNFSQIGTSSKSDFASSRPKEDCIEGSFKDTDVSSHENVRV